MSRKCVNCVWAKWTGTGFFCPWPRGVCMKPEKTGKEE